MVVLARFRWRSSVMSRKEVGRLGLGQSEGNDPVLLWQEMRRSG